MTDIPNEAPDLTEPRTCPWCSAPATEDETKCHACGAALAQRESLAGLVIPGVTAVHPALVAFDAQPTRLHGPSPSQGMASGAIVAAVAGGPAGLAALGGIAAVAAVEYLGARNADGSGPVDLESLGKPSEAALMALERIEREGEGPVGAAEGQDAAGAGATGDPATGVHDATWDGTAAPG
jgi:hypothetical protein